MSGNVLRIIATILEKTALGAHDSEIAEMLEMVREASPSATIGQDIERLHLHLKTVAQFIRDRGVSERGLSLLIDTTHDLSSTLVLRDLLRTIVSRARSLVGANIAWLTHEKVGDDIPDRARRPDRRVEEGEEIVEGVRIMHRRLRGAETEDALVITLPDAGAIMFRTSSTTAPIRFWASATSTAGGRLCGSIVRCPMPSSCRDTACPAASSFTTRPLTTSISPRPR